MSLILILPVAIFSRSLPAPPWPLPLPSEYTALFSGAADLSKAKIKIGFIGCGGRGTGAANQTLQADSNIELWAMGEAFRDKIDTALESLTATFKDQPDKLNVAEERKFVGLDAYQKVIDSGVDVVILTTTPAFRPQHIKAAVDAGKHVFAEKPMAVDGPGLRSVIESAKLAKEKNLALVDGFVWRWTKANREAYEKIHAGAIGDIRAIYSSYYTGSVDRYPKWNRQNTKTDLEWQLRRWYYFTWLSGDHIVEQAIHSIDKMLWTMKDEAPASVVCSGGRQARPGEPGGEYGNIFDHFAAEFRWENGVKGYHFSRQIGRCFNGNTDEVVGSKGVYQGESGSKRHVIIHSDTPLALRALRWAQGQWLPDRARLDVRVDPERRADQHGRPIHQDDAHGHHGAHGRLHRQGSNLGGSDEVPGKTFPG